MVYPEQRFATKLATFQRETVLPEGAVGVVLVTEGARVDIRDWVARGIHPTRYALIEAAQELRLRDEKSLPKMLLVKERARVARGDAIAGANAKRGRRVFAPFDGFIVYVGEGRIIMQELPEILNVEAGVRGRVTRILNGRGVTIEATGALVQGVWGNGRSAIANLRMEPEGGIESLSMDQFDASYRNEAIVLREPLTISALRAAERRLFAGIIAPSMDASLLDRVMEENRAVLLTEGFGKLRMSAPVAALLQEFDGYQAMVDAAQPGVQVGRRPEIVINRSGDEQADVLRLGNALRKGVRVRIVREPNAGLFGRVIELPSGLQRLENGLRVRCALVELTTGVKTLIPLTNLELAGG